MNKVSTEHINKLLAGAEYHVSHAVFGKHCILTAKLPNGFTIVGKSACVDPANYDEKIGIQIAKKDIENQLWAFEGYLLQQKLYENQLDEEFALMQGEEAENIMAQVQGIKDKLLAKRDAGEQLTPKEQRSVEAYDTVKANLTEAKRKAEGQ